MAKIGCQVALQIILDEIDHQLECQLFGMVPPQCTVLVKLVPHLDEEDRTWLQAEIAKRNGLGCHSQVRSAFQRALDELAATEPAKPKT